MKYSLGNGNIQFFGGRGAGGGGGSAGGMFAPMNATAKYKDVEKNKRFNTAQAMDLKNVTGVEVSDALVRDLEPLAFKRVVDSIKQLKKENPELQFDRVKATGQYGVLASTNGTELNVNPTYFYDRETMNKVYQMCVDRGFHPKNTTGDDIVWHEYGHMLVHRAIEKDPKIKAVDKISAWNNQTYAGNIVKRAFTKYNGGKYDRKAIATARMNISEYATKNWHETIAEAYADYHRNGKKANKFSIAICEELNKLI